ncbi:Uncharacterised protein [BD1-7 clade bacterium]|uniref:Necrosis inducing protein (NPP1) n=1 Tax=BD1-7 clade bacterium TaxID=2029982 RepID=A0A5S9Q469_9GAMM|nr:Uncharacterised protein [BD1-7 clade bacterium]CAA0112501.1 Uncharacterised protein [BD1-7 clade bacterium]
MKLITHTLNAAGTRLALHIRLSFTLLTLIVLAGATNLVVASDFPALDEAIDDAHVLDITPIFDFDGDGCFPAAGISRDGKQNPGLKTSGSLGGDCRASDFLATSNTLHRSACVSKDGVEYCGHFFALYFEKDQVVPGWDLLGHRHDWEQAAVWTKDGVVTHAGVSAHGNMDTRPLADVPHTNSHPHVVYHKDGGLTHSMRFAKSGELAENPYGEFVTPPIISWYAMYGDNKTNAELRRLFNTYNFDHAVIPMKDGNFFGNLNRFKPSSYPEFFDGEDCEYSDWFSEEGSAQAVCRDDRVAVGIECSGRYCDNKRLKCCNVPGVKPHGDPWEASHWISEEAPNSWSWNDAAVVGMKCSGRYCDNLKLIVRNRKGSNGVWTNFFSEEQGLGQCPKGSYIAGVRCSGRYCDNLSLYCQK